MIERHARCLQHLECSPVFGVLRISKTSMLFGQHLESSSTCSEANCLVIYLHHLNSLKLFFASLLNVALTEKHQFFAGPVKHSLSGADATFLDCKRLTSCCRLMS